MEFLIEILVEQPLLLLFVVMTLGYVIGEIHVKGIKLGVAAVLFVGLAFGAIDPRLSLPPLLINLGLVLFVYCVGLQSGPGFVAAFRRHGLRNNAVATARCGCMSGPPTARRTPWAPLMASPRAGMAKPSAGASSSAADHA